MQALIPNIEKERPPFVRFEQAESGIDPELTKKEGRPIPRLLHMAYITPHGSKDMFEYPAEQWLQGKRDKAMKGEYPIEWVTFFERSFQEYLKGNELPREGTPILTWPMIARQSERKLLIAQGITTVEDLAVIPDHGLPQIGLNGRYLRDLAKTWVAEAKQHGVSAKALADANAEIDRQNQRIEAQQAQIDALAAQVGELTKAGGGGPPERGTGRRRAQETEGLGLST